MYMNGPKKRTKTRPKKKKERERRGSRNVVKKKLSLCHIVQPKALWRQHDRMLIGGYWLGYIFTEFISKAGIEILDYPSEFPLGTK